MENTEDGCLRNHCGIPGNDKGFAYPYKKGFMQILCIKHIKHKAPFGVQHVCV